MSAEQNKALVRRFFEALEDAHRSRAGLQVLDKILAPNFISHTKLLPGQQPGREGHKQAVAELSATSSNTRACLQSR